LRNFTAFEQARQADSGRPEWHDDCVTGLRAANRTNDCCLHEPPTENRRDRMMVSYRVWVRCAAFDISALARPDQTA
jgi:hypothetical protein